VYFLKRKSKTYQVLKNLKVLVEIVSEYEIKALKFDNRGEFTLIEFNIFCEKHDI